MCDICYLPRSGFSRGMTPILSAREREGGRERESERQSERKSERESE